MKNFYKKHQIKPWFVGVMLIGIIGAAMLIAANSISNEKVVITHRINTDGKKVSIETIYRNQAKVYETQLNDKGLYDGPSVGWSVQGAKVMDGNWVNGFFQGEWKYYDTLGNITAVIDFEKGRPLKYRKYIAGHLVEVKTEEWPETVKHGTQTTPRGTGMVP